MICANPYMAGNVPFGCGQCLPCRINRRRLWTWRMYYESQLSDDNCFVTLTYADEFLPAGGSLAPSDLRNFLKRLRKSYQPRRIRFFAVGEYGDESQRPHYHAVLFGIGAFAAELIHRAWKKGLTRTDEFNETTAAYVAGYTVKKMTSHDDPRLNGRYPEFARMSLKPGIGAGAMAILADQLHSDAALDDIVRTGDVPRYLQIGRRSIPIGRYLRQKLREEMGMPDGFVQKAKQIALSSHEEELLSMYMDTALSSLLRKPALRKEELLKAWQGKIWSLEGKQRIYRTRKRNAL